MINLKDLLYIKRGFLSKNECDEIIEEYQDIPDEANEEHCPESLEGVDTWSTYKVKQARLGTDVFDLIHKSVETMVCEYHDYLDTFKAFHCMRRTSLLFPHTYRIMKYDTGAWIHPHTDHAPYIYGSCTINLNEEYTGGDFSFWNGNYKVKLNRGDAMIWPADYFWVHAVDEIQSGTRYSVNCFLRATPEYYPEHVRFGVPIPIALSNAAWDGNKHQSLKDEWDNAWDNRTPL